MQAAGFQTPPWFVVNPQALQACLTPAQQRALAAATTSETAQAVLAGIELTQPIHQALAQAMARLGDDRILYAVRSSALDEDASGQSFAGQLESVLNAPAADVVQRIVDVWRSGFTARVYAYRQEHGLRLPPPAPAVIVQRMMRATCAGVAFSADPVSGRRAMVVVAAVPGLGEKLVSGAVDADVYHVDRQGAIILSQPVDIGSPVLSPAQVRAVAALARRAEAHAGRPQDIEWASENGQVHLLQSRPITTLANRADPDGAEILWDNSNIVESYGGVTTPLTYTFARRAYAEVYRQFCTVLGVPAATIAGNAVVFDHMIGLIQGRIYYNLINWYRVLAMLPGFRTNRRFMEQMMGVKEGLPEALVEELANATTAERNRDRIRLVRSVAGLIHSYQTLAKRKTEFYARLDRTLGDRRPDLSLLRADELVAYYRRLEQELLTQWDAPLINDFFAMLFYGLLRRLTGAWCGDTDGSLQNDLLAGEGEMVSAEPAERIRLLAAAATEDPAFVELLNYGASPAIQAAFDEQPLFAGRFFAYLDKFGDRCAGELKLESLTLHDDPLPLLRAAGRLAAAGELAATPNETAAQIRIAAENRVDKALSRAPWRKWFFHWILAQARLCVRDRENLRFQRTRVFGRARQIFVELGNRLAAVAAIQTPRDIFYLEIDEIFGFVEGTATCVDLKGLVALRKVEFERYANSAPPADRFVTRGMVNQGNAFQNDAPTGALEETGDVRRGIGCGPGLARGRVRIIGNPLHAQLEPGEIIVAPHTDPSWILILPAAAGLVVERGSLLSHAAIVARELGIPTVVGMAGATSWLRDGDWVEIDGGSGLVQRNSDLESTGAPA
ncbi:MAG: phosphoenolpyruvate synthase [Anaerolineales bacterium]|nr:phosphoenolpyruvate synthase [Anaerolineales bacterium]